MHRKWFQEHKNSFHYPGVSIIHLQFTTLACLYLHAFSASAFARASLIASEISAMLPKTTPYISIVVLTFSAFNSKTCDTSALPPSVSSGFCWRIFIWQSMRSCTLSTYRLMLWSSRKAEMKTIGKRGENNISISNIQFLGYSLGRPNYPLL